MLKAQLEIIFPAGGDERDSSNGTSSSAAISRRNVRKITQHLLNNDALIESISANNSFNKGMAGSGGGGETNGESRPHFTPEEFACLVVRDVKFFEKEPGRIKKKTPSVLP